MPLGKRRGCVHTACCSGVRVEGNAQVHEDEAGP